MIVRRIITPLATLAFLATGTIAPADAPRFPGTAVLANTGNPKTGNGKALIVWDATDEVADIVSKKQDATAADARIAHDALHALAANLAGVDKGASSVTVRVVYQKTGAVSPVYGTATLAGVERYATLTMTQKDATGNRESWESLKDDAALPSFANYKVLGQLPPQN